MIKAVLFDCDGVIRNWDGAWTRRIEDRHSLPPGAIDLAAFEESVLNRVVTGRLSDEEWRDHIRDRVCVRYGQSAVGAVDEWISYRGQVDAEMVELVAEIRTRVTTGLLSNASTRLETDLEEAGLADAFHHVFNSARMGCAKPDPQIYATAIDRLGLAPERVVFMDDLDENVDGARRAGLLAFRFEGAEDARRRLTELRVLR